MLSLMTGVFYFDVARRKMTVADTFRIASENAVPFVDAQRIASKEISAYEESIRLSGVKLYCYISFTSFFKSKRAILQNLEKDMTTARRLGAKLFMINPYIPFRDDGKVKRAGKAGIHGRMIEGFRIAVDMGKRYGLIVCFEPIPRDILHMSGIADCKFVLDNVPGLGFVLDTSNALTNGEDAMEAYRVFRDRIVHVHLKDVVMVDAPKSYFPDERAADGRKILMVPFGKGIIPVKEIYETMIRDGYGGVFALEYTRPDSGPNGVSENIAYLGSYLEYLQQNAPMQKG